MPVRGTRRKLDNSFFSHSLIFFIIGPCQTEHRSKIEALLMPTEQSRPTGHFVPKR